MDDPQLQNKPTRAPVPVPEMTAIRQQIDMLDAQLVALLAHRQTLIQAAGKAKPRRDTVRDEARIEEVMRLVLAHASKHGLSHEIAEPIWRHLIELSIAYEYQVYDQQTDK